jgi:hypothetical protein
VRLPKLKVSQDLFDDARVVDKAEYPQTAAALGAGQRIRKIDFLNQASPGASAKAAEIIVRSFIRKWGRARGGCCCGRVLPPPLSAGFVAIKSVIAGELESFFRDKCGQGGEGVQGGDPFRGGRVQVGVLRCARIVSDDGGVPVVMQAGERKGGVNEVGSEPFPGGAVGGRNAFSLVGGQSGMVEAVEDNGEFFGAFVYYQFAQGQNDSGAFFTPLIQRSIDWTGQCLAPGKSRSRLSQT